MKTESKVQWSQNRPTSKPSMSRSAKNQASNIQWTKDVLNYVKLNFRNVLSPAPTGLFFLSYTERLLFKASNRGIRFMYKSAAGC